MKPLIAQGSFRGAGFAREPGSREHGLTKPRRRPVFMASGPGPYGPSRNDGLTIEWTRFSRAFSVFASVFMAAGFAGEGVGKEAGWHHIHRSCRRGGALAERGRTPGMIEADR